MPSFQVSITSFKIQSLSQIDMMAIIPVDVMAEIKQTNPHPYFQAYSICHEGVSSPKIIGEESKPIHWFRAAVQSIKNTILKGIQFFTGHNDDNSTTGREELGRVVADKQMEIDGILHHVVIGYFPDKEKVKDLDVCSQEGNWSLIDDVKQYIADKVEKITGIALANSKIDTPAFAGAKRLAIMQAFEYKELQNNQGGTMPDIPDVTKVPEDVLISEIQRRRIWSSKIYSLSDLKNDREFKPIFDEKEKLDKDVKTMEEKVKNLETEKGTLGKQLMTSTAAERLNKILENPNRPLTANQKGFIKKVFDQKIEKLDDITDAGLDKFIEDKLDDFKASAEIFKIKDDKPLENNNIKPGENPDKEDYTKASNNELLEEDFISED